MAIGYAADGLSIGAAYFTSPQDRFRRSAHLLRQRQNRALKLFV